MYVRVFWKGREGGGHKYLRHEIICKKDNDNDNHINEDKGDKLIINKLDKYTGSTMLFNESWAFGGQKDI